MRSPEDRTARRWTVFIPGHWPGYSQVHKSHQHYAATRLKLRWQESAALLLKVTRIPRLESVYLSYLHRRADRRSDKSNLAFFAMKTVEDALVQIGVIQDDKWRFVDGFEHDFEITKAEGLGVTVWEVVSAAEGGQATGSGSILRAKSAYPTAYPNARPLRATWSPSRLPAAFVLPSIAMMWSSPMLSTIPTWPSPAPASWK